LEIDEKKGALCEKKKAIYNTRSQEAKKGREEEWTILHGKGVS